MKRVHLKWPHPKDHAEIERQLRLTEAAIAKCDVFVAELQLALAKHKVERLATP